MLCPHAAAAVGEVVDFMPITGGKATDRHRPVRIIRVVRGEMRFELDCPCSIVALISATFTVDTRSNVAATSST